MAEMSRRTFIGGSAAALTGLGLAGMGHAASRSVVDAARGALVDTEDSISLERARLITEGYRLYAEEPTVVRRASAFAHLLDHMTLDLESNPLFAGNTAERPRAWALLPEYSLSVPAQARLEHDWLREFDLAAEAPEELRAYWSERAFGGDAGIGHLAAGLDTVVHRGLEAVIAEARALADTGDERAREMRRACIIACEGVIRWAERYRVEAARLAEATSDVAVRAALLRVAAGLEQVPARPARNLFEGLQAIVLTHLAVALEGHGYSVSIGLPDRALAPFADEASEAGELFAGFLLKIAANSLWGGMSKTQAITIGGADSAGRDQCNAITLAFLEACDAMRLPDPHVFLRWRRGMAPEVKAKAIDMLARGVTQPLLVGDEETASGLIAAGIAPEDAWNYCVIGCNEIGIPGKLSRSATGPSLNYAEQLSALLQEPEAQAAPDMASLLAQYEARLTRVLTQAFQWEDDWWQAMAERVPTPFTSGLFDGAIARGADLHAAASYPHGCLFERGLTNAIDGLIALDTLVFQQGRHGLAEMAGALADDFADAGLHRAIAACPKWGNDLPEADAWAERLLALRKRTVARIIAEQQGRPRVSCHVVRSLHWLDGLQHGASMDGRRRGEPYAACIGPNPRDVRRGPTAVLNSVAKLQPRRYYRGGYNLNLTLPPNAGRDVAALGALVEAFFAHGGQELQVSVLDAAMLREAMERPGRHPHVLVRIAGFTARFATLSRMQQEALVQRAEDAALTV